MYGDGRLVESMFLWYNAMLIIGWEVVGGGSITSLQARAAEDR